MSELYADEITLCQTGVKSDLCTLTQTQATSEAKVDSLSMLTQRKPGDPLCTLNVHSVKPDLSVPKLPTVDYSMTEIPTFLKRRLARRYEERGEPVPDYLKVDETESV